MSRVHHHERASRCRGVGVPGWVYGVGIAGWVGEGYTGTQHTARGEVQIPAKRAPNGPAGAGSGWVSGARANGRRDGSWTTPAGPGRSLRALPVQDPQNAALGPIRRELTSFLKNIVKTAKCHQNMSKRPRLVPVSKTGSESHLLIFWEFGFCQPSLTRN